MADLVMGIASSHTPLLSSGVDMSNDHAERHRRSPRLLGTDARYQTYSELLTEPDPVIEKELAADVRDSKYRRCQQATKGLIASPRAAVAGPALAPVLDVLDRVTLATRYQLMASSGFAPEDNGIKVFNRNPARVIPALGTNP